MTETITAPSSTRTRPLLSTDALAVLLQTSRPALTKQLQRTDFPEHLSQDGRTRFWSFAQVENLVSPAARNWLPAHMLMDAEASHQVQYLGPTISTEAVTFWFLVDGLYGVGYSHATDGAGESDGVFVQSHWTHPRLTPVHHTTIYLATRGSAGGEVTVAWTHAEKFSLRNCIGWDPSFEELESILNLTLPLWPAGTADPEKMAQWHPGARPVQQEIHSSATSLLLRARNAGRLKVDTDAPDPLADLFSGHDYLVLQDYLMGRTHRDAVVDVSAADRFEALERSAQFFAASELVTPTQTLLDLLHLWAPDDEVARELVDDDSALIAFAPTDESPMVADEGVTDTVLGYVLSRFIGVPRTLLQWGVDAEFSVNGEHHHIEAVYARRPGGRWWVTRVPKHW